MEHCVGAVPISAADGDFKSSGRLGIAIAIGSGVIVSVEQTGYSGHYTRDFPN